MLAFTKPASMAIAVVLGITLSASLAMPAFSGSADSTAALQSRTAYPFHNGDLVRLRSGGPLMTVTEVHGNEVNCSWADWDGQLRSGSFPIASLGPPLTLPPEGPNLKQDERAADQYYRAHCPSGSVSIATGKFECVF